MSDSDAMKTYHVRQNGRQLQLLRTHDTDKTEDANFIASYQVSFSIHKNDFYTKRKLVKDHSIRHASSQNPFFSTCIINLTLKKEYAGLRVKPLIDSCSVVNLYSFEETYKLLESPFHTKLNDFRPNSVY